MSDAVVAFASLIVGTVLNESRSATLGRSKRRTWPQRYASYNVEAALATFSALRQWNLALVCSLSAGDLARPVNHPERGDMTLRTIVETMGGHDRNHLKQVEEIAG